MTRKKLSGNYQSAGYVGGAELRERADELRSALSRALETVETHVHENLDRANSARNAGDELLAQDWYQPRADQHAGTASPEFKASAWALLNAVAGSIATGDAELVIWLANRLKARNQREWLARCQNCFSLTQSQHAPLTVDQVSEELPVLLSWLDEGAHKLTSGTVRKAIEFYSGPGKTVEGFAARLACECGAFGYGSTDQHKAQKAFANLTKSSRTPR